MAKSAMAKAFGAGDDADYEDTGADDMSGESELPPDYESAYEAYEAAPSAQTFWEAVKACTEAYAEIGVALPIGKSKKT